MKSKGISRRHFLGKSAATAGIVTLGPISSAIAEGTQKEPRERLPREVWIASISQMNMKAPTTAEMVDQVIDALNQVTIYNPDPERIWVEDIR